MDRPTLLDKFGAERLVSTACVLLYLILSDHGATQPSHIYLIQKSEALHVPVNNVQYSRRAPCHFEVFET